MLPRTLAAAAAAVLLFTASLSAAPLEEAPRLAYTATGFVLDSTHPQRPGDVKRHDVTVRAVIEPASGDARIELTGTDGETAKFFVREGRPLAHDAYGDLAPETLVAMQPWLLARALADRGEHRAGDRFAWNDALWRVELPARVRRSIHHDVRGDGEEEIRFSARPDGTPHAISVHAFGREIARFELGSVGPTSEPLQLPDGKRRGENITPDDVQWLADLDRNLYAFELRTTNSRVVVAEFADFVVVLEGAANARNGDLLARIVEKRFGKPIRYFAFSHLHGLYSGSTRSFIAAGATIVVPPKTVPLIEEMARAPFRLRPDALSGAPREPTIATVDGRLKIEDDANALEILSVPSGHTDDYLIFWFPRQKVLVTGDLLCYRGAAQPLRARSKLLCSTIADLNLDVETMVVSWPLGEYGCADKVTFEDFRRACAAE